MSIFWLKLKCFFSMLYSDIRDYSHYRYVMCDRTPYRIEEKYVRTLTGRVCKRLNQEGMIRNLLGTRQNVLVQVALDDHCATVSFFETLHMSDLDKIADVQKRMRMLLVDGGKRIGMQGIFRYIYRSKYLDYAHNHDRRIFDPQEPLLVLQPAHWEDEDIFGTIHFKADEIPELHGTRPY